MRGGGLEEKPPWLILVTATDTNREKSIFLRFALYVLIIRLLTQPFLFTRNYYLHALQKPVLFCSCS